MDTKKETRATMKLDYVLNKKIHHSRLNGKDHNWESLYDRLKRQNLYFDLL